MNEDHVISDELLEQAALALSQDRHWMAYNTISYFLEENDVYFFKDRDEAEEFASSNISEYDDYRVLHISSVEDILKCIPYGNLLNNNLLKTKNLSIMDEKNLEYLKDNIKYMGFGEGLNEKLENNLKQGLAEFNLNFKTTVNKKPFEADLHFRKSENTDMYFFNSYKASLQKTNGENVDQTFYLNKGKGVTAKEAYNMLEGRSVFKELSNKEGVPYNAWIQLDFQNKDKHNNNEVRQFHENYGYDVKAAVAKYPVAELKDPEKEKALMQSLQKGNIQSVTLEKDGTSHKMFIEANPQYKTINLYDGQMKRVQKEGLEQYKSVQQSPGVDLKQEQKKEVKEDVKQDVSKDTKQKASKELDKPKQTKGRSKSHHVS